MSERSNDILLKCSVTAIVVLPLLGTLLAIVLVWNRYMFPSDLALLLLMYCVTIFGTTIGFHRMLTHQGFSATGWLRAVLLIFGSMSFQSAPNQWAAMHIVHHAHSDEEGDPHSPLEGFWHAHMGWLWQLKNYVDVRIYAPHLLEDPVATWVSRTYLFWGAIGFLIPYLTGGWTGLLWGGLVRMFLVNHVTYSVNSVCHCFGKRAFETTDESRNEWVVGLLGFGEGWHNNHHAFPTNAFHGMRWWQVDLSGYLIRGLEKFGLVWDVQRVSAEAVERKKLQGEGMRGVIAELQGQLTLAIETAQREMEAIVERVLVRELNETKQREVMRLFEQRLNRLREIHANVQRAARVKKQLLRRYLEEVQSIARQAKGFTAAL